MMCGCNGNGVRQTFRLPPSSEAKGGSKRAQAAQVGASVQHEVLTAGGRATGRTFSSLVAAQGYASRIGGTTRPKR